MSTLQNAITYAISNRTQYGKRESERRSGTIDQASRLAAEGVDYIQLREKDLSAQDLIGLAREILNRIRASGPDTCLLINSRPDIALAAGATGVHLPSGEDQLTPAQVRELFRGAGAAKAVVSVSCHTLGEVRRARQNEADLILFGPVFGKSVSGQVVVPEAGLQALRDACESAGDVPVLALGGFTAENSAAAMAVGASGIAAIRLFA